MQVSANDFSCIRVPLCYCVHCNCAFLLLLLSELFYTSICVQLLPRPLVQLVCSCYICFQSHVKPKVELHCFRKWLQTLALPALCSLKTDIHPFNSLFFQDNLGKPTWERLNQTNLYFNEARGDAVAPRFRQIITSAPHHSIFYRPDALCDVQPTASPKASALCSLKGA